MSNEICAATAAISIVRQQTNNQLKVKVFLDTIGRNSLKTKRIYETALVHFQEYLNEKYDYKHTLETIVNEILSNNIDLYELIDGFLAYGITKTKRGEEYQANSYCCNRLFFTAGGVVMTISLVHLVLECFRCYYLFNYAKGLVTLNLELIGC